jgi:hypothetical protein
MKPPSADPRVGDSLEPNAPAVTPPDAVNGVGGWLLLLSRLLIVGQPINLALSASTALDALPIRGLPLALVLIARLLVTSLGIAAGLALSGRRPGAVILTKWSLVLSGAMDVFVYTTPYYPNNRFPGDTTLVVGASLAYHAVWLAYLFRSRRVRNTFPT